MVDIMQITLIFSALTSIVLLVEKIPMRDWIRYTFIGGWIIFVGLVLIFVIIIPFVINTETTVTIVSPGSNARVSSHQTINGTIGNNRNDQSIWLLVYPQNVKAYYPQTPPPNPPLNGTWSGTADIGMENDTGSYFTIYAVLADDSANKMIRDYLEFCRKKPIECNKNPELDYCNQYCAGLPYMPGREGAHINVQRS